MTWAEHHGRDTGELSTGWSLTCGLGAAVIAFCTGNVPLVVFAISITAIDLTRRMVFRVGKREHITDPRRPGRVDGLH